MLRVFIGYDERQPLAFTVAAHSVVANSSIPVAVTPLILSQLPIERKGLTQFTYSRFLVPWLCGFQGQALFIDPDVVVIGDVAELFQACATENKALCVNTQQPRFEWASAMHFDCAQCEDLTPEAVESMENLLTLKWAEGRIGSMPAEWNHCVGYAQRPDRIPKLLHFTEGVPCWPETAGDEFDAFWHMARDKAVATVPWFELMGKSVHAPKTLRRFLRDRGVSVQ